MLGLDSEISIHNNTPISSNQLSSPPSYAKETNSTNHVSSRDDVSAFSHTRSPSSKTQKSERIKELRKKLREMENTQKGVEEKLTNYVRVLEKELRRKQDHNQELENNIKELKTEIQQSKADVDILLNYFHKKKNSTSAGENSGVKLSSPAKNRLYVSSKGKNRSPGYRDEQKSPTIRKNKIFAK